MNKTNYRIFKAELSRAFGLRRFGLAVGVAFLILVVGYIFTIQVMPEKSYIDHWYYIYIRSSYTFVIPLLVALPYTDSLVLDRKEGFIKGILARSKYKSYIGAKILANGIAGGLAAALPLVVSFGLLSLTNGNPLNHPNINVFYCRPQEGFLGLLFREHQFLFLLTILAGVLMMGFLWATLGLSISLVINNRYVAIGFPFLVASFLQYFVERARRLPWFLAPSESLFRLNFNVNNLLTLNDLKLVLILPTVLLFVAVLIWCGLGRRRLVVQDSGLTKSVPSVNKVELNKVKTSALESETETLPVLKNQTTISRGIAWLRYLRLQARLLLQPYVLIGVIVVTVAVGLLFGKIIVNSSELIAGFDTELTDLSVTAWDVFFAAMGNAYSMGLVFTPMFLLMVSNLQPESSYGQMAGIRISSRWGILTAKLVLLVLVCLGYLALITGLILLVGSVFFGFPLIPTWSKLGFYLPDHINMVSQWVMEYSLIEVYFKLMLMVGLGLFALGLLMLAINSLSRRRLVGFFVVLALVLASFGLAYMISNTNEWLTYLPIIRNLVLPMFPWPGNHAQASKASIRFWLFWIVTLLPLSVYLMKRQDFYSTTETE